MYRETKLGRLDPDNSTKTTASELKIGDWIWDNNPERATYVGEVTEIMEHLLCITFYKHANSSFHDLMHKDTDVWKI
jgi:hypothetical protein